MGWGGVCVCFCSCLPRFARGVLALQVDLRPLTLLRRPCRLWTVLDAPGHPRFVRNALAGMAAADVGLLVVSADPVEFADGVDGARLHVRLAHTAGVRQIVVAVTKMDVGGGGKAAVPCLDDGVAQVAPEARFLAPCPLPTALSHAIARPPRPPLPCPRLHCA